MAVPATIIIIEDNPHIREGYRMLINSNPDFYVSHVFENCEDALVESGAISPEIILMDIDLPGMDGIEGTKVFKKLFPKSEIIIVTVFENSERVFEALCAGACGYLTKTSSPVQLLQALTEAREGGAPMSAKIARMVIDSFKQQVNTLFTDREYAVLRQLVEGKSYKTIAKELFISLATVKFHIKNIYIKLQVDNKEDAISKARKEKLI